MKIIGLLLLALLAVGSVHAVGKPDLLTDITNLCQYYYDNRCTDPAALNYGDLTTCNNQSNGSFILNRNDGLAMLSWCGERLGNGTYTNASIDGLMALLRLQNDDGPWITGSQLQNTNSDQIQVYGLVETMLETYNRTYNNMTVAQRAGFQQSMQDVLSWMLMTPVQITYQNAANGNDRLGSFWFRKSINISDAALNSSDNFHLRWVMSTQGAAHQGNITIFVGNNNTRNYTYDTRYANIALQTTVQMQINKSSIRQDCPFDGTNYQCNFTWARNSVTWNSTQSFTMTRGTRPTTNDNRTWTSTDGVTWSFGSNIELHAALYYYNTSNLDKINEKICVANQNIFKAMACDSIRLMLNATEYPLSSAAAQQCTASIINTSLQNAPDGVFNEWNENYRAAAGAVCTAGPSYAAKSSNYYPISGYLLCRYYERTGNTSVLAAVNQSLYTWAYLTEYNELKKVGTFGSRDTINYTAQSVVGLNFTNPITLAYMVCGQNISPFMAPYMYGLQQQYVQFNMNNNTAYSTGNRYSLDIWPATYVYDNWPTVVNTTPAALDQTRFVASFNQTGIIAIGTQGYVSHIAYFNNSPSGAISSLRSRTGQFLFTGSGDNPKNNTYGFAALTIGNISTGGYSSVFDTRVVPAVTYSYPYMTIFSGNMTRTNPNSITNITYQSNYTYYDDRIEISQAVDNTSELQMWVVEIEDIGNGVVLSGQPRVMNNVTFLPLNFNLSYWNLTDRETGLPVDKINASGTSFRYIVGITYGNATDHFQDSQGRRLALPLSITGSGNTRSLTSNLSDEVSNITASINTAGITPSSPRITYPDGSSEYPSYSYDSVAGVMTFTTSLPSGTSVLLLHTQEDGQSCYDFTFAERAVFVLSILAGLVGFVYFVMSGSSSVAALLTGIFAIVIFLTIFGRLVGGIC